MKNNYKLKDFLPFFIFGIILVVALIFTRPVLGLLGILGLAYVAFLAYNKINRKNEENLKNLENLNERFDSLTKQAIFDMPFPLVVTDEKAKILWYNTPFINLFNESNVLEGDLENLIGDIDIANILNSEGQRTIPVEVNKRFFNIYTNIVENRSEKGDGKSVLFYLVDNTAYQNLKDKYTDEFAIVAKVEVDNFDEAISSAPSEIRPLLIAEIDSTISQYFEEYDALVRKSDEDLYLVVMNFKSLRAIKEKRFDILDDLRDLNKGNSIPITLSIGVSSFGLNFKDAYIESDSSLDLALGRGGDQAVVKVDDNYEFFGGKSKAMEKRNKVKARVIGEALKQLIDRSENVYIMGHKNPDMDAIGAAIGCLRATLNRNKEGFIVLEKSNPSIDNLIDRMKEEEAETYEKLISRETALSNIKHSSLLILVDNHKPSFTECPDLLEKTNQIVVIDHHRRGKEFVDNPVLQYVEPYASSTCELITEMLTYMSNDLNLTHFEADALMSGIVVDTKNFSFQTGVRTFEAASILKRAGANMLKVKALFQDDLDTMVYRAEVIHNTKMIHDNIAVSRFDKESNNSVLVAAQAADALLDINGIDASFVLTINDGKVHISGRSRGEVVSVQLILEKIGGGGHLNMAGAQLDTTDLDEAEKILINAIDEYLIDNKSEE
ncbi:MAG: DHH family phosphoesterase [Peptoniphilus harei]|uniref:DHH family phosphoesterase n=1 Tax=Peptoniphilus TaxID=162289 RepID=UPI0025508CB1|nr:DHH family phosphoesterase [Peptoniphilus harei]MDK7354466.1 DHH family phosphoesterase [Peptoniphilus harei]MDK7369905.1 DHH family phosphoesterase [Peptoniphilus harei]MDK7754600.1 DHH family phosphoesterase [Peptoniphilus harei]MDK7760406.1 DHH family phosphoesterase [Peptoniphilus harei]MDK8270196.1 DHH family phosphoesterase [Peptoniphilus harei]